MSINRGLDKEDMVSVCVCVCVCVYLSKYHKQKFHIMEYYSATKENEIMPLAATWIDLETISEVSEQRIKHLRIKLTKES